MSKESALYALTWDPITYGHIDVIKKARKLYDLTVWIWVNPDKVWKTTFSLQERVRLIQQAIWDELWINVTYFVWLLIDYAFEEWFETIIRWVRGYSDIQWEMDLDHVWATQIEGWPVTTFIPSSQDKSHISSSVAKALLKEQGILHKYVPLNVKQALEARVLWQYVVSITWSIWTWKSYITDKLVELWKNTWIPVHNIDLDVIWHDILGRLTNPWYIKLRQKIAKEFWLEVNGRDCFIDRPQLAKIVFSDPTKLKKLNEFMRDSLLVRIRREMRNKKWLILLNWALISEFDMSVFSNNNVIVVDCDKDVQLKRVIDRSKWALTETEATSRINSQFSWTEKISKVNESISKYKWWKVFHYQNNGYSWEDLYEFFNGVVSSVDIYWELRFGKMISRLWKNINPTSLFMKLKSYYDQDNRFYHNIFHIVECLNLLDKHFPKIEWYEELFFAIIFHDIIYDMDWNNEERSANYAENILKEVWYSDDFIERVKRLILVTKHNILPENELEKIIIDLDLSILWSDEKTYKRYAYSVRQEYLQHSDNAYYNWRKLFLAWMLQKERIFHSDLFRNLFESKAKENMFKEKMAIESEYWF